MLKSKFPGLNLFHSYKVLFWNFPLCYCTLLAEHFVMPVMFGCFSPYELISQPEQECQVTRIKDHFKLHIKPYNAHKVM